MFEGMNENQIEEYERYVLDSGVRKARPYIRKCEDLKILQCILDDPEEDRKSVNEEARKRINALAPVLEEEEEEAPEVELPPKPVKKKSRYDGLPVLETRELTTTLTEKPCPKCKEVKPIADFGKRNMKRIVEKWHGVELDEPGVIVTQRLQSYCKDCRNPNKKKEENDE